MTGRLTTGQAQALQKECIARLQDGTVQDVLREELGLEGNVASEQAAVIKTVALPELFWVISRYGFDPTVTGFYESLVALIHLAAADKDVLQQHRELAGLLCPFLSDRTWGLRVSWAQATDTRLKHVVGIHVLVEYVASLCEYTRTYADGSEGEFTRASSLEHEYESESSRASHEEDAATLDRLRFLIASNVRSLGAPNFEQAALDDILSGVAYKPLCPSDLCILDAFLQSLLPSSSGKGLPCEQKEEFSCKQKEEEPSGGRVVDMRDLVDMCLDYCGASVRPLQALALDRETVRKVVQGTTVAGIVAIQEEVIAALSGELYHYCKRRAQRVAGSNSEVLLMYHGVLTPALLAPIMAKHGYEVSLRGWMLLCLIAFAHRRTKQVVENSTTITLLGHLDRVHLLRTPCALGYQDLGETHEEIREVVECMKVFRRALDAGPSKPCESSSSHWICIHGPIFSIPEPGTLPATILPGCPFRALEEVSTPDGEHFLRLDGGSGWLPVLGATGQRRNLRRVVRLGPRVGRLWRVVGGAAKGGVLVRSGKELSSAMLRNSRGPARLQMGAQIREEELVGERLRYSKVQGEGPDFGWISVECKGSTLVRTSDWTQDGS